ncbi:hypothetical protein E2C01_083009 [Portunus trituberculatus]|uniref:Uncharacterized protein n=1 Tax=Portunus trituberculatus TaxID=210409 RepID=A0A5B7J2B2_PORTR|nr:hypothetical protein [Portunus trituberculatus]
MIIYSFFFFQVSLQQDGLGLDFQVINVDSADLEDPSSPSPSPPVATLGPSTSEMLSPNPCTPPAILPPNMDNDAEDKYFPHFMQVGQIAGVTYRMPSTTV